MAYRYNPKKNWKEYTSKVTVADLERFRQLMIDDLDLTIALYIKHYHHKKTMADLGEEYGITRQAVHKRLSTMRGHLVGKRVVSSRKRREVLQEEVQGETEG